MIRRIPASRLVWAVVVLLVCVAVAAPAFVHAQQASSTITNPIGCNKIDECVLLVVNYVLGLAGVLALAAIVYGGFLYITAAGNQDRIEQGKHAIFYSIVGLVVIALSYAILTFVFRALSGPQSGGLIDRTDRGGGAIDRSGR